MKSTIYLVLLLAIQVSYAAPVKVEKSVNMTIYEAINKAGYQRMLTQRIAKSYFAILGDMEADSYKKHLKGCAKIFDTNLKELSAYAPTEDIKKQFRYVEILWRNYKFIYSDSYSMENGQIILQFNEKILTACHEAVVLLENYAHTQTENRDQEMRKGNDALSRIINISGRQRMLSQRMFLFTLANFQRIGDQPEQRRKFEKSLSDFKIALKELMSCPQNTEEIDGQLLMVSKLWNDIEEPLLTILNTEEPTIQQRKDLIVALKKSEQVLFTLDEIVFLYERIGG